MSEIYKEVLEYEGLYKACDNGSIIGPKGWKLKPAPDVNTKYLRVILCKDGKHKGKYVHRLVWEAFNGPIPPGMEINHIDEDKSNNALSNLELVTHKQNMNHGTIVERRKHTMQSNGIIEKYKKPVKQYSYPEHEFIKQYDSVTQAQKETGVKKSNISVCLHGKGTSAGGFMWEFA